MRYDTSTMFSSQKTGSSSGFEPLQSLFAQFQLNDKGGYITQEFQDFGYRMALELDDMAHKSLYIKMAKREKRALLEAALSYVKDAKVESKAKLFMWKIKQLKAGVKPTGEAKV
jgi:hypothetical protein